MILDELAAYAAYRVEEAKKKLSPEEIRTQAEHLPKGDFRFEKALKKKGMSFICEVKKASPSKGVIAEEFPYTEIARAYEAAGADCVSVLTEPKWFLGSDDIFREIREAISLPMIRKDFTVDPYQIYEAKLMGADAVLLICALLPTEKLKEYLAICEKLGLTALVETHDEAEIASAVEAGARPELEEFYRRFFQFRKTSFPDSGGGCLRGRIRGERCIGCGSPFRHRGRCGTGRRSTHEGSR